MIMMMIERANYPHRSPQSGSETLSSQQSTYTTGVVIGVLFLSTLYRLKDSSLHFSAVYLQFFKRVKTHFGPIIVFLKSLKSERSFSRIANWLGKSLLSFRKMILKT